MPDNSLSGKSFVVAGGSQGIGLSITRGLHRLGATVHVMSRTTGELPQSDQILHQTVDFATEDTIPAEFPETIHGAVYCPGTINLRSFRGLPLETFRHDFEVNLLGAVKFLKGCLSGLKKGGAERASSVVLFSTVAVQTGLPMHCSVASAKGGVEGLTRSLAAELAPAVRVNCLAPALTDTPLAASFFSSPEKRSAMDARYPLARAGQPEDLAEAALWLLEERGGWITGQIIHVDGGLSSLRV